MPDQALFNEVGRFFSDRLNVGISSPDEDLFETGILDSLTFVDLVLYLEEQFDVRVGADDMEPENFRSVAKIAAFVAAHSGMNRVGAA